MTFDPPRRHVVIDATAMYGRHPAGQQARRYVTGSVVLAAPAPEDGELRQQDGTRQTFKKGDYLVTGQLPTWVVVIPKAVFEATYAPADG
jgi:hypothetical protein